MISAGSAQSELGGLIFDCADIVVERRIALQALSIGCRKPVNPIALHGKTRSCLESVDSQATVYIAFTGRTASVSELQFGTRQWFIERNRKAYLGAFCGDYIAAINFDSVLFAGISRKIQRHIDLFYLGEVIQTYLVLPRSLLIAGKANQIDRIF